MKKIIYKAIAGIFLLTLIGSSFVGCQKMDRPPMNIIPDDTARLNGPLQLFLAFEDSPLDSIHDVSGTAGGVSYVEGQRGKAYKGSSTGQILFGNAGKLSSMTSFTVAFWMNTEKHSGGAQSIFMLPRTSDFWGNLFAMIEGNDNEADNSMLLKFHFAGNWVEFTGNNGIERLPDMYGKWRHLAFSYDENTSKFAAYLDGQAIDLPAAATDRKKEEAPLGPLVFPDASQFVIGAFQQHIGVGNDPDAWMLHYTGMLDEFRVYTTALSATEINALFAE